MAAIDSITSASNGADSLTAIKSDITSINSSITSVGSSLTTAEGDIDALEAVAVVDNGTYATLHNSTTTQFTDDGKVTILREAVTDSTSKYGITSVTKRTTGNNDVCGMYTESFSMGGSGYTTFGAATVAGTGDQSTEPTVSSTLVAVEAKVFSQYHNNTGAIVGVSIPFANRSGEGNPILRGSVGNNLFNDNSRAIQISSQAKSSVGEHCGWNTGIYFNDTLDVSGSRDYTCLIDFQNTTIDKDSGNPWIFLWKQNAVVFGIRYNTSNQYLEFYRDVTGTPTRKGYLNMTSGGADHAM